MSTGSRFAVTACALTALWSATGAAQTIGGAVPAYEPPPPAAAPQRDGNVMVPVPRDGGVFRPQEQLVQDFAAAYQRAGKPRLAFFWNRQLTDALSQWYSTSRVVVTSKGEGSLSGDFNLQSSGSRQVTGEVQRRADNSARRLQPSENWEWEFQDGFLGPFLKANAFVVDRSAIIRSTSIANKQADDLAVEAMALQGMADWLIEVLVAPGAGSTVGYELRARVLDTKTGQILSYVNSRGLKEWNQPKPAIASNRGFELPDDDYDDEDAFGPQSDPGNYRATSSGFERKRKPPRLSLISQNLAYNVMTAMMTRWR